MGDPVDLLQEDANSVHRDGYQVPLSVNVPQSHSVPD